jgi:hypothetical protein
MELGRLSSFKQKNGGINSGLPTPNSRYQNKSIYGGSVNQQQEITPYKRERVVSFKSGGGNIH